MAPAVAVVVGAKCLRYTRTGAELSGLGVMFRGIYEHTLDQKGRVSVPSKLREAMTLSGSDGSPSLILTRGLQPCLVLYPCDRWRSFEERLLSRSQFDPVVIRAKRIFVAGATECTFDPQGRISVPLTMRRYARLEKEVVWVGQLDTLELWSPEAWQEAYDAAFAASNKPLTIDDEFAKALAQLGL